MSPFLAARFWGQAVFPDSHDGCGHLAVCVNVVWVLGRFLHISPPTRARLSATLLSVAAYTLYKARNATKSPCCAICLDRTRGRTQRVGFGYGVSVWLCADHASVDFLTRRSGRDLVVTLSGLWNAAGAMTANRHKAMLAHLAALKPRPPRPLPGSYAWPRVRVRAEALFATGRSIAHVSMGITSSDYGIAQPPSHRTIRRWHTQRRWTRPP